MSPAPSEFEAVIVDSTDTIDVAIEKAFIRFPVLFARWYHVWFNEDGTLTTFAKEKICAACPQETN